MPPPKTIDVLVGCAPCQPFSKLSRRTGPPESHELYYTIFGTTGSLISFTKATLPHVLVSENVCGTLETRHTGRYRDTPPIQDIVAQLMASVDETGELWFVEHIVLRCNAGAFVQQKRPRLCFKLIIVVFVRCWIVATRAYLDFVLAGST